MKQNGKNGKSKRAWKPYRTYSFKGKDPMIFKLQAAIDEAGVTQSDIHEASGVATTTMYNWFKGKTRRPQFASLNAAAMAVGRELTLTRVK